MLAVALAALWGFGIYFGHDHGRLRFLDRLESTSIDLRTLMRGVKAPPDLVTIIAIDDNIVKQTGVYPLSRTDLAKIVDIVARLEPESLPSICFWSTKAPTMPMTLWRIRSRCVLPSSRRLPYSRKPASRFFPAMTKARSPVCRPLKDSSRRCRNSPIMRKSASSTLLPIEPVRPDRSRCCFVQTTRSSCHLRCAQSRWLSERHQRSSLIG